MLPSAVVHTSCQAKYEPKPTWAQEHEALTAVDVRGRSSSVPAAGWMAMVESTKL